MRGILKERFVWNVDFVEGGFFFVLPIKRRVFHWSKYRVLWCYLWSNS